MFKSSGDEGVLHAQYLTGLHVYGIVDVPPGSEPGEQRKKTDSDPDSGSATTCVWWRNPQPSADSKQWESDEGRRKRDRKNSMG